MSGNKSAPLVSVIINCYNGDKYLNEAIDSVFTQTYTNWEIIFWDNCSTDKSAEIAKSYGEKVRYFYSYSNTSLGEARNEALKKVKGKYVCFIDCDDIWSNTKKIELQVNLLEENPEFVLCFGNMNEISENGEFFREVITNTKSGYSFPQLLKQFDISIITSMLRNQVLIESGLSFDPNIKASEEYCLFMQLACNHKIGVIDSSLASYRVSMNSLTSKSLEILGKERRYTLNKIIANDSYIVAKYPRELRIALARADYYDARWFMQLKKRNKAIRLLWRNIFLDFRYLILLISAILPYKIWDAIHLAKRKRV
jgi:glycosyltransferase involved in cell wall biosynthesis